MSPHYTTPPAPAAVRMVNLQRGTSPVVVQKMLEHSRLETSERYLDHLELEELWEWVFSLAGGGLERGSCRDHLETKSKSMYVSVKT